MKRIFSDRVAFLIIVFIAGWYLYLSPNQNAFNTITETLTKGYSCLLLFVIIGFILIRAFLGFFYPFTDKPAFKGIPKDIKKEWLIEYLKRKGFKVKILKNGIIKADKGSTAYLPVFLRRLSLAVVLLCLFISANLREYENIYLIQGKQIRVFDKPFVVEKIKIPLSDNMLLVSGDEFRLKKTTVVLNYHRKEFIIDNGYPHSVEGLYFIPAEIGYKHKILISWKNKILSQEVFLEVFPPGRVFNIRLSQDDMILGFQLYPKKTIKKGMLTGMVYNLNHPIYKVTVRKANLLQEPTEVIIKPDQKIHIENFYLSLDRAAPFLKVHVVKDPAVIPFYISFVGLLIGILLSPLRLWWFRQRILIYDSDQTWEIFYFREKFVKWSENALEELLKGLNDTS